MLRVAVVGLGRRSQRHAIPYFLHDNTRWHLEAVCDSSGLAIEKFKVAFPSISSVPTFADVSSLISSKSIDCAYVAVPHYQSPAIVKKLLSSKLHVIREEPAAMTAIELKSSQELARLNAVTFNTASQMRYSEQAQQTQQWLPLIGKVRFAEGIMTFPVRDLGAGWRASRVLSGGGVLLDLGWHLIDLVLKLLGDGTIPGVVFAQLLQTRPSQEYDCEDTARAILNINNRKLATVEGIISCNIFVSRLGPTRKSQLTIYGESGSLRLEDNSVEVSLNGRSKTRVYFGSSAPLFHQMMRVFHAGITEQPREFKLQVCQDMSTMQTVDDIYAAGRAAENATKGNDGLQSSSDAHSAPDLTYRWLPVNEGSGRAVQKQLQDSDSIYDNNGDFGKFEKAWKERHGLPNSYTLLHSSGRNAFQALYFAIRVQPGDEVIFPVYSFDATSFAAMQFGVVPIFCDSLDNGNISPEAIAAFITPRTKAVVVTHMWGMPCNMRAIRDILRKHPNVLLIEDCSHAHGAKIDGQFVGTFGDAAAWSLQGIDIVSGGEGGITLTKNPEIYYRQLVWGHHNKRCKAEIPSDHPLSLFSLNEVGNKHRAHPLAIALAFTDLERLDSIRQFKALYASQMVSRLASIPFLHAPSVVTTGESRIEPAWYAFILRFIGSRAPDGLSRKSFVGKLHERGLREVNIPRSTGLLHQNPLYKTPHRFFPHAYPHGLSPAFIRNVDFPAAQAFSGEAIKLPVWTSHNDQAVVNHYLDVICDVAREEIGNLNGMD